MITDIESGVVEEVVCNNSGIDISKFDAYHPIVVVGEPYDSLSTYLINNIIDDQELYPFVVDIYNLQPIADVLSSPKEFKKYIEERTKIYKTRKIK